MHHDMPQIDLHQRLNELSQNIDNLIQYHPEVAQAFDQREALEAEFRQTLTHQQHRAFLDLADAVDAHWLRSLEAAYQAGVQRGMKAHGGLVNLLNQIHEFIQ